MLNGADVTVLPPLVTLTVSVVGPVAILYGSCADLAAEGRSGDYVAGNTAHGYGKISGARSQFEP